MLNNINGLLYILSGDYIYTVYMCGVSLSESTYYYQSNKNIRSVPKRDS